MKISVKTHPKSSKIEVLKKDETHFEVWVREAPEKGKANTAVIEALSDFLGLPRSRLMVSSGHASRNKVVEIRE